MTIRLALGFFGQETLEEQELEEGTPLLELAAVYGKDRSLPILGALYNHRVVDLYTKISVEGTILWLDMSTSQGMRIYKQSVIMLLAQAVRELFPHWFLDVHHALGKHTYCEFAGASHFSPRTLELIEEQMGKLVKLDEPIVPTDLPAAEALPLLEAEGYGDTAYLLREMKRDPICIYRMGGQVFHSYHCLAPSAGCLHTFKLMAYEKGFLLCYPTRSLPRTIAPLAQVPKLASVLSESKEWTRILNVYNVAGLSRAVSGGPAAVRDLIHVSEALQEKYLVNLADQIYADRDRLRLILIAGPSSSGKTTFCYRLATQQRVLGLRPVTLSTDDYFVNREDTPRAFDGSYDFESLRAIDVDLFNRDLACLVEGGEVLAPTFDFRRGLRMDHVRPLQVEPGHPILVEGIHALNEALTPAVGRAMKFKIYISSMVQIDIDNYNRVSTSDARLLRRLVRDSQYRGRSAADTLIQWPSVRRGEEQNIFPYQEEADAVFNTALVYETGVFKKYAEPLLQAVDPQLLEYADAQRLLAMLAYFPEIGDETVPLNSILREFIGGSSIHLDQEERMGKKEENPL